MGLDMYLSRDTYIWSDDRHATAVEINPKYKIQPDKVKTIVEDAGYWRKANAVHNWFVQNVQGGSDDCGKYEVSKESLKELYNICIKIKKNKRLARKLLPTQEGFFFGDTDYDEYYFEDIDSTIEILEPILANEDDYGTYYYQASW